MDNKAWFGKLNSFYGITFMHGKENLFEKIQAYIYEIYKTHADKT
jgi:hypothetical protein